MNYNNKTFISLLLYLDVVASAICWYIFDDHRPAQILMLSFGLLLFQAIFLITFYFEILQRQKQLLNKKQQDQLIKENNQLKEYSTYLENNEDELRRFKHDYQNILNGLRISAESDNAQELVNKLDKYTHTQFDQKALRKYKGVNHLHVAELKSIIIAKLAKLYNLQIPYSFDCQKDVYYVPQSVNLLDIVRIIGITYDNAAEESQQLIKETGNKDLAKVDALIYPEDGNLEFSIRNKISHQKLELSKFSQKGYSTKKDHMGLGLSNVKEIAKKYEQTLMIDYGIKDNWFTFNLVILANDSEK